ncbi:hypothetical protein F4780DRAFT_195764 [Xylariomycetidae sp. FL0641]|nr:hypothetical protein F4780DRAFT_195764 [Xylariomycetidae sp. FL0641]
MGGGNLRPYEGRRIPSCPGPASCPSSTYAPSTVSSDIPDCHRNRPKHSSTMSPQQVEVFTKELKPLGNPMLVHLHSKGSERRHSHVTANGPVALKEDSRDLFLVTSSFILETGCSGDSEACVRLGVLRENLEQHKISWITIDDQVLARDRKGRQGGQIENILLASATTSEVEGSSGRSFELREPKDYLLEGRHIHPSRVDPRMAWASDTGYFGAAFFHFPEEPLQEGCEGAWIYYTKPKPCPKDCFGLVLGCLGENSSVVVLPMTHILEQILRYESPSSPLKDRKKHHGAYAGINTLSIGRFTERGNASEASGG